MQSDATATNPGSDEQRVQVRFYATYRSIVGEKYAAVSVPRDATLRDLLAAVLAAFPALRPDLVDGAGELSRYAHLFVNGRGAVHLPEGMETRLAPEDVIDFFPAVAGG